ncbi:hypothetical protein GLYMA_04G210900v4 [Glycine max]|nr:hypothetical protein GLYMA_04G210900v4 [Glycine max]KAH1112460.1 hypothetical protein GYH30_010635 [Glycine max]
MAFLNHQVTTIFIFLCARNGGLSANLSTWPSQFLCPKGWDTPCS